ncbi:glycoside hydrolase family 47 protein [Xylona heveae TC161]|uniref:alpha-1,2-Mannosidase n=1 Tax=Xylona heveae (strain CBS 132557 / TC161) TaxID=1328760 RepID=A0A161TF59_XYLHT|nr:glycoside hydrolase family 47 protein [Xylona heveae TC161]KZF24627.1 glycoside hydrolase family 47 protein [Xylona heveae TC161]
MNNFDPFNVRRSSAFDILRATASIAPGPTSATTHQTTSSGQRDHKASEAALEGPRLNDDMSFSIPPNVPNFSSAERRYENGQWESSGRTHRQTHATQGLGATIGGLFEQRDLPMYKDKPFKSSSGLRVPSFRKKRFVAGAVVLVFGLLYWLGLFSESSTLSLGESKSDKSAWRWLSKSSQKQSVVDWERRREFVKEAFTLSWDAYERYAWGFDEFHPVSKTKRQMGPNGLGWIIVDSLDTLILMNLTSRLSHAREWVSTTLTYDQDQEVNTFETTIRMLGGLLSAHYLSNEYPDLAALPDSAAGAPGEDLFLEKASDLANRLLGAYDSPSGIPYASVNLRTMAGIPSHNDGGASSTAEAASLQLEMKYLAKLTGEKDYWDKAEKIIKVIDDNQMEDGLLPIFIYADQGTFRGDNIRLGSRGDSYYEYLIKQYLQTSKQEPIYQEMWDESLAGIRKHLITYSKPSNLTILAERPNGLKQPLSPKMDHLVCFMPGTIALAVTGGLKEAEARASPFWGPKQEQEMELAKELMRTCWGMYKITETGLAPEIAYFNIYDPPVMENTVDEKARKSIDDDRRWREDYVIHSMDAHNLQRPETVESLFYMWRITGDVKYRQWGWEIFKAFVSHSAVFDGAGFTSLAKVTEVPAPQRDNMESFWLAETLKYLYLLFSPDDLLPLEKVVINTEAHIFPRFELGNLFKTGWTRQHRNSPEPSAEVKKSQPVQVRSFSG